MSFVDFSVWNFKFVDLFVVDWNCKRWSEAIITFKMILRVDWLAHFFRIYLIEIQYFLWVFTIVCFFSCIYFHAVLCIRKQVDLLLCSVMKFATQKMRIYLSLIEKKNASHNEEAMVRIKNERRQELLLR